MSNPQLKTGLIRSVRSGQHPVDTGHLNSSNNKLHNFSGRLPVFHDPHGTDFFANI